MCPTERARGPFARPPRLPPRARGTWGPSRPPATLCPTEGRPGFAGPSPSAGPGAPVEAPVALRPHKGRGPASPGRLRARGLGRPSEAPSRVTPPRGAARLRRGRLRARGLGAPVEAPGRVTPPRGAARLRRAVSERAAWGARRGPRSRYTPTRSGPASPGRLRARGGLGRARPRPPVALRPHEGRPGFAGPSPSAGGLGGPSRPPII